MRDFGSVPDKMMREFLEKEIEFHKLYSEQRLKKQIDKLCSLIAKLEKEKDNPEQNFLGENVWDADRIFSLTDDIDSTLRTIADMAYRATETPRTIPPFYMKKDWEEDITRDLDEGVSGIAAYIEDDKFYIRTPLLNSRKLQLKRTKNGVFSTNIQQIYANSVRRMLERERKNNKENFRSACNKLVRKEIYYLFVSAEFDMKRTDCDQYDNNAITNAITEFLSGGDAPDMCRFRLEAMPAGELPEGTYICVHSIDEPRPEVPDIVRFWSKKTTLLQSENHIK